MKTKTRKQPVRKAAKKQASSKYACSVCGTVIEADPCDCGCDAVETLVCCGKKMTRKRG